MPRGPKGEKRPADVIGNAVHVMRTTLGAAASHELQVAAQAESIQLNTVRADHLSDWLSNAVCNDFTEPREVVREAISNAFDAGAL